MAKLPPITVSTLDLARLEALLEKQPDSDTVRRLEDELDRANVVAPTEVPDNIVTMNSTITFTMASSKETFTKTLCYPRDMDGAKEKISVLAPIGAALIGLAIGQSIQWPGPNGKTLQVTITAIDYQPERAGDYQS
ncbi:nucleoside diphosphate kinase regulator [Oceanisphaera arctica]|uniref:Nucleoside diphosphate kinase regulator n=1 Tax=Oceanisphaera arctica TaxID=641510 RepID=A0A2P5TI78_9GAMM|nr:nucleoside diphosphate kinase regulator [Oceanisphaera arctica]PPL14367.1 nucleoside diphosphate kinase regulator [Oceanisphaera arctica]GHA28583.1 nucleoside diphosphate kinase regulator [Oceanisphaera arctica]